MATRLLPPEGGPAFSAREIISRLRDEFAIIETDVEEGRDHFSAMIEQFLRMNAPQAIVDRHVELQESAVFVTVADEEECGDAMFQFVAADGGDVFVGYSSAAHESAALPLVRRCNEILGYEWMDQ